MSEELEKELKKETVLADEDRKKFISMLAEANLIEKPFELKYQEMGNIKKKLDGVLLVVTQVINNLETIIGGIIQKSQDRFLVAYNRFLNEVKQELAQIQKDYDIEVLKKQNSDETLAIHRSLEWFKQECKECIE
jgi:hypothetical protein